MHVNRIPSPARPVLAAISVLTLLLPLAGAQSAPTAAGPLDPAPARAELRYAADRVLEVHPALTRPAARAAFERALAEQQAGLGDHPSADAVAVALQRLLASLGDAHTTAAPQAAAQRVLPLVFFATSDALLVSPLDGSDLDLPDVARVVRLGTLTPDTLQQRMAALVPGPAGWVRYRSAQMIGGEPVLRWLGLVDAPDGDGVEITVRGSDGTATRARVPLVPIAAVRGRTAPLQARLQRAVGLGEDWARGSTYLWRIDEASGTGLFWLLSCVDSPAYRDAVDAFFQAVHDRGLRRIVLDLQFDGGGNSNVTTPWLQHLPARAVHNYGEIVRPSQVVVDQRGTTRQALIAGASSTDGELLVMQEPGALTAVPPSPPIFTGSLIVLTNGATFSSAGMIATILSDNGLARVAGEPMGAEPGGYGDILSFRTPVLGLPFTVSYKRFTRPAISRGDALPLDVPLPLTANDVLTGRDVLAAWLRNLEP